MRNVEKPHYCKNLRRLADCISKSFLRGSLSPLAPEVQCSCTVLQVFCTNLVFKYSRSRFAIGEYYPAGKLVAPKRDNIQTGNSCLNSLIRLKLRAVRYDNGRIRVKMYSG